MTAACSQRTCKTGRRRNYKTRIREEISLGKTEVSLGLLKAVSLAAGLFLRELVCWLHELSTVFQSWEEESFFTENCQAVLGNNEPYYRFKSTITYF